MIRTLCGENSFALQSVLSDIISDFTQEHGELALERIDGQEADFNRIQEAVQGLPFLASKKLVVLRSASSNKRFTEKAEQLLGDIPETNDIVIVETKLDKRLSYYKFLKSKTEFREFNELDVHGLAQWLSVLAKERGGSIGAADARFLVERIGLNQQMLASELEKLLLYQPAISRPTILLLTDANPQSTVFQLLEAAFAGNARRTLELYAEQRALKVEPAQIVAMLSWQLNILAIIKTAGQRAVETIASDAKLNPFVVRKSMQIARQLSLSELKERISQLLHIDLQIKSSIIDADEALQHYLLQLTQ
jgi:DNA polymerase-3 subunit delta